ncbi:hypothetical protein ACIPW4_21660 [Pseudomonas sp. NPDC089996]|uniref:hypothetical protein n=1 Tax=Pseudomonas sp. NPDC089996 TaxID=3364474 RepID=UPI003824037A
MTVSLSAQLAPLVRKCCAPMSVKIAEQIGNHAGIVPGKRLRGHLPPNGMNDGDVTAVMH